MKTYLLAAALAVKAFQITPGELAPQGEPM